MRKRLFLTQNDLRYETFYEVFQKQTHLCKRMISFLLSCNFDDQNWVKSFTDGRFVILCIICWDTQSVNNVLFDNYCKKCPMPLSEHHSVSAEKQKIRLKRSIGLYYIIYILFIALSGWLPQKLLIYGFMRSIVTKANPCYFR